MLSVERDAGGWHLTFGKGDARAKNLVVGTGGLSMPRLGASPFGYQLAEQFGLNVLRECAVHPPGTLWPGEFVTINLVPDSDPGAHIDAQRSAHPDQSMKNTLSMLLPKRLIECLQQLHPDALAAQP